MARRRGVRLLFRATLVVGAITVLYVGITFIQVWNASNRDGAQAADAIVVLGAAQYDGVPSPVLEDRLEHALDLYENEMAPTIIVTGGRQEGDRFTEATTSYNYLREHGVPDEAILKEVDGKNTWEQIAATARILRDRDLVAVVLVTDDYHAYRVAAVAEEVGLEAHVSPVGSRRSTVGQLRSLTKETIAVSVGRFIGYRRLVNLDDAVERVRDDETNG